MNRHRQLIIAAAAIAMTIAAAGCHKPDVAVAASDSAPSAEPVSEASSAAASDSQSSSSAQVADNGPVSQGGNCTTITIGGGYTPGFNGQPGTYSPGQQMTTCSPPAVHALPDLQPARAAAAPVAAAAAPVAATPAPAAAQPASTD